MEHLRCAATTARVQHLLMLGALALATVLAMPPTSHARRLFN